MIDGTYLDLWSRCMHNYLEILHYRMNLLVKQNMSIYVFLILKESQNTAHMGDMIWKYVIQHLISINTSTQLQDIATLTADGS